MSLSKEDIKDALAQARLLNLKFYRVSGPSIFFYDKEYRLKLYKNKHRPIWRTKGNQLKSLHINETDYIDIKELIKRYE